MKGINPKSKFSLTIKELIAGALGLGSLLTVFFTLKADIALAKIKNDFENMKEDISDIKDDIKYIKDYIIKNKE